MATATTQFDQALFDAACAYLQAGLSLIPINRIDKEPDGDLLPQNPNGPGGTWQPYQERQPTLDEVRYWVACGANLAVVTGRVSGGLAGADFDVQRFYDLWKTEVGALASGLVVQRSGRIGGGYHVFFRCPDPGRNSKLAYELDSIEVSGRHVAIELKAEGGYILIAPSLHQSGNRYEVISGDLSAIPVISQAHADALINAARKLDEAPYTAQALAAMQQAMQAKTQHQQVLNGGGSVIDLYNQSTTIENELQQQGYRAFGNRYIRPGGTNPSVTIQNGKSFHHSSNDPLSDGHWHDAFDLYCYYQHGNDPKVAARAAATLLCLPSLHSSPLPTASSSTVSQAVSSPPNSVALGTYPRLPIDIADMDIPLLTDQAWSAIQTATQCSPEPVLYRRGSTLCRVQENDAGKYVALMDSHRLRGVLSRTCKFQELRKGRQATVSPPDPLVHDMLVNVAPALPILNRLVKVPCFAADSSLLTTPGYHQAARTYYDPRPGVSIPALADQPTVAEIDQARSLILDDLLGDFPFVEEADRAHAVALLLLPFVREMISGPTPLHLIEAPTVGSGKGLLSKVLLFPGTGAEPTLMTGADSDDEWRKRITSALLEGPSVLMIDNINATIDSGALAAALTTTEWSDRLLGQSEMVRMPVRCAWLATANNPTMSTEIARRCIRIRIDPKVDRPWKRSSFKHSDLWGWANDHHGELIWAALTLIRAGLAAGTPGRTLGSYESWARLMGQILSGVGINGFLGNLESLYERADTETGPWRALVEIWYERHASQEMLTADLYALVENEDIELKISGKTEHARKISFGMMLNKMQDRVFTLDEDGPNEKQLRLEHAGIQARAKLWKLVRVDVSLPVPPMPPPPSAPPVPVQAPLDPPPTPTPQPEPPTERRQSDIAHDMAVENQVKQLVRESKWGKAEQTAQGMRGRKDRQRVIAWIEQQQKQHSARPPGDTS